MKKVLLMTGMVASLFTAYATESQQQEGSKLLAQYQTEERQVWASYVSNGRLMSIKILIRGNKVIAYANGTLYGQDYWQQISPLAVIKPTHPNYDGTEIARQFKNRADLYINGRTTLPVYF